MIKIVSVLLGLVAGIQPVEISVTAPVAQVEVQLDGAILGVLDGPPWVVDCDFGEDLTPHRLTVIGRDANGQELERVERLINVETESAAASLSLVPDAKGKPTAVRLSWQSIGQVEPTAIEVTFDDQPLVVENPRYIPLPRYDLADFHFVEATLYFNNEVTQSLQAGFGGELGDILETRLTAVAVDIDKGRLPVVEKMDDWFTSEGTALKVHGIEKGVTEILVVRDPSIQPQLDRLAWYAYNRTTPVRGSQASGSELAQRLDASPAVRGHFVDRRHGRFIDRLDGEERLRGFARLGSKSRVRFVAPASALLTPSGVQPDIFLHSAAFSVHEEGLGRLAQIQPPQRFDVQLADAVALAGLVANSMRNRRAVVLLLGDNSLETSRNAAATVRRYLQDLGVPLIVARFGGGEVDLDWGEVFDLGNLDKPAEAERQFERVFEDLDRRLAKQRLVWLIGHHLPQQIELGPKAKGIRLAGR